MNEELFFQSNKSSMTLEHILKSSNSFEDFEKRCSDDFLNSDCRLEIYLARLLENHKISASSASVEAKLSPALVGHYLNGRRFPKRDALICIALGIGASVEETQYLLKYAGYNPLYVRSKRDVIIWFGLSKKETLDTVNENIKNHKLEPLYSKDKE